MEPHVTLAGAILARVRSDTSLPDDVERTCARLDALARELSVAGTTLIFGRRGGEDDLVGIDLLTLANACAVARDMHKRGRW